MARPRKKIDPEMVESLAAINCSMGEIASTLKCSIDTLERRFAAVIKRGRDQGKTTLKRQMWRKAITDHNTTMQIFLSKNMLGYSDKREIVSDLKDIPEFKVHWDDDDGTASTHALPNAATKKDQ